MIELNRLNQLSIVVNCAHIVTVEATPDTVVTLTTGEKLLVRDSVRDVVNRTARYLRQLGRGPTVVATHGSISLRQQEG